MMTVLYIFLITLFSAAFRTLVIRALLPAAHNFVDTLLTGLVIFIAYFGVHYLEISGLGNTNIDFLYAALYFILALWLLQYTEKQLFQTLFVLTLANWFSAFFELFTVLVLSPILPPTLYFENIEKMILPVILMILISTLMVVLLHKPLKKAAVAIRSMQPMTIHYAGCVSVILIAVSLYIKYHQYNVGYLYEDKHIHSLLYSALSILLVYGFYDGHRQSLKLKQAELNSLNLEQAKQQFQTYLASMHDFNNLLQSIDIRHETDSIFNTLLQSKIKQVRYEGLSVFYDPEKLEAWLAQPFSTQEWINLTLIFGIFFDNASEHLLANPRLGRHLHIKFMTADYCFTLSNPVSNFDPAKLEAAFAPGTTTKSGKLLSGFGLYNAVKMAEEIQMQVKWHWHQQVNALEMGIKKA